MTIQVRRHPQLDCTMVFLDRLLGPQHMYLSTLEFITGRVVLATILPVDTPANNRDKEDPHLCSNIYIDLHVAVLDVFMRIATPTCTSHTSLTVGVVTTMDTPYICLPHTHMDSAQVHVTMDMEMLQASTPITRLHFTPTQLILPYPLGHISIIITTTLELSSLYPLFFP